MCYTHFSKRGYYHFKTTTTTTKRPDSKCFLTTGKAFTALHLLKCWFQMPSFYIVSNKRTHSRALPVTESVASCFFHSHRQTCGSRGKLSFLFLKQKSEVKKRGATMEGEGHLADSAHSHPSRPSWPPHWLSAALFLALPSRRPWPTNPLCYGCAAKPRTLALASVAQWVGASSHKLKGPWLMPCRGTCLGCGFGPQSGLHVGGNPLIFLSSLFLSLPLSFSNENKINLKKNGDSLLFSFVSRAPR